MANLQNSDVTSTGTNYRTASAETIAFGEFDICTICQEEASSQEHYDIFVREAQNASPRDPIVIINSCMFLVCHLCNRTSHVHCHFKQDVTELELINDFLDQLEEPGFVCVICQIMDPRA